MLARSMRSRWSPALRARSARVGRHLTEATLEVAEAQRQAWVDPGADKWFRIVVIDARGRRAWTNPIWVDAFN